MFIFIIDANDKGLWEVRKPQSLVLFHTCVMELGQLAGHHGHEIILS